jgi:hypothetical protein
VLSVSILDSTSNRGNTITLVGAMAKRTSTYINDRSLEAIGATENLSGELNRIVDRYDHIVRTLDVTKRFTPKEIHLLHEVGKILNAVTVETLKGQIAVHLEEADPVFYKFSPAEFKKLTQKINELNLAEEICLVEEIERFWKAFWSDFQGRKK